MSCNQWVVTFFNLLLCLASTANSAEARSIASSGGATTSRLPALAKPIRYQMKFEPDLVKFTFDGEETVSLQVYKPTRDIYLNAAELKLSQASISRSGERTGQPGKVSELERLEQVRITFPTALSPGKYALKLVFKGTLNDKLRGFYRSFYKDEKGVKHTIATTQMEPTDARRMFPCFDEPAYKASYQITAVIPSDLTAISNAAIASERREPNSHKKIVTFAESPVMSTYLVTLIVGDFESTPVTTVAGVPIRVWSVRGKAKMGAYASKIASQLLPFYNSYFGVPYPAKKLDLIAIPDFEAGAMENLGAITFRESGLLVDAAKTSAETLQAVASVTAHEMAHLWFGDLVTMKWWDDLWLNEAFATWMATKAVDRLIPEWHFWDEFALSRAQALQTDSLKSTRPIHFTVDDPNQINEMFDEITYEKGASVLRMLETYVGESVFQSGVQQYIAKHKFANASTEDLWQAVGLVSHRPIPAMMHGWVFQPGYPMISIFPVAGGKFVKLSQARFLLDSTTGASATRKQVWHVPVAMRDISERSKVQTNLLESPESQFNLPTANAVDANAEANGFYRVHYPDAALAQILPLVQSKLSSSERLGLLTDQWSLAVAGKVSVEQYLALTASYKEETDPSVAKALIGELHYLSNLMEESAKPAFERLVQSRLGQIRERLGWTPKAKESDLVGILRGDVIQSLGTIGQDRATIEKARSLFEQYLKNPESVEPNLLDAITSIVAYNGGNEEYEQIKRLWKEAKTPETELRNLMSLSVFRKPELVKQTLSLCLSDEVRTQDAPRLLSHTLAGDFSKEMAWQFIKEHWSEILKRYPLNMVPRVVSAASSLNTPEQEQDLQSFFKTHEVPAGKQTVARLLERVHIYTSFKTRSAPTLAKWLERS
jgi:puromycin-sensitive aminopeptidase